MESLVFPECSSDLDPKYRTPVPAQDLQDYALVLTNERGSRSYGYCRRVLPEGASHCLPLAYCIVSRYRAPAFYYKVNLLFQSPLIMVLNISPSFILAKFALFFVKLAFFLHSFALFSVYFQPKKVFFFLYDNWKSIAVFAIKLTAFHMIDIRLILS